MLSYSGLNPSRIWLAAVVCTPRVANRSFIPIGTPAILPSGLPAARSASTLSAASSAFSGVATMNALSSARRGDIGVERLGRLARGEFAPATPSRIALTPSWVISVIIRSPSARRRSHVPAAGAFASTLSRTPPPVSGSASTTSSRRRNACGITAVIGSTPRAVDLAELFDPGEDVVQLGHHPVELVLAHPDAREAGDLRHGFAGY